MKHRYVLILLALGFFSCSNPQENIVNLNGIWIPKSIDWEEGSFEIFYVYNDTCFAKIASTQVLVESDSISFMSEPGFILSDGKLKSNEKNVAISYRILYRFINIEGEKIPSNIITDTLKLKKEKDSVTSFNYQNKDYIRTDYFTTESKERMKSIATKFATKLKEEYKL
jgi:hypothetical protein